MPCACHSLVVADWHKALLCFVTARPQKRAWNLPNMLMLLHILWQCVGKFQSASCRFSMVLGH